MEFRICGILDENGQIQSVQSSCAHSGLMPVGGAAVGYPYQGDGVESRENKVVNYAVKKDLDRKLHAKVDEMSQIMIQLSKAQENEETLRKLNKEYEEKISRYDQQLRQLQDTNNHLTELLRKHGIPVPDTESTTNMHLSNTWPKIALDTSFNSEASIQNSGTSPKIFRSSTTEVTLGIRHSTISMTDSLYSEPLLQRDSAVSNDENIASGGNSGNKSTSSKNIRVGSYSKPIRPKKLDIPNAFKTDSPETNTSASSTVESKENNIETGAECNASLDTIGTSCNATGDASGVPQSRDKSSANGEMPHKCVCDGLPQESKDGYLMWNPLPIDSNGYLIFLVPTNGSFNHNDIKQHSEGGSSNSNSDVDVTNGDQCSCSECHDNNAVHVTWLDFHTCRNSCSSPLSPKENQRSSANIPETTNQTCVTETRAKDKKNNGHYVEIPFIPDDVKEELGEKEASATESDKDLDEKFTIRAPQPLPRDSSVDPTSPSTPPYSRRRSRQRTFSTPICTSSTDTSPDTRKVEDKPNNVMKLMRKTSEWNSTKKALLEKSVTSTTQDADNTLGSVVKKTIESYQEKLERPRRRGSKNMADRLVKHVKESLKNKHDDDVITTEFLEKCVQLCEREFLCQ